MPARTTPERAAQREAPHRHPGARRSATRARDLGGRDGRVACAVAHRDREGVVAVRGRSGVFGAGAHLAVPDALARLAPPLGRDAAEAADHVRPRPIVGAEDAELGGRVGRAREADHDARHLASRGGCDHRRLSAHEPHPRRSRVDVDLLERVDHAALVAAHHAHAIGPVRHDVAVVVPSVPAEAVLRISGEHPLVHDPAHLVALRVDDREGDLGGLGEVEADARLVAIVVAVRREVGRLGREADHERELALEQLRREEGGDGRHHEHGEHRPDQGPGHGGGSLVGALAVKMSSADASPARRSVRGRPALRPCAGRGAGAPGGAGRARDLALRPRSLPRPRTATPSSTLFYRAGDSLGGAAGPRCGGLLKAAEHVPDMLRYRSHATGADVSHWQWLWLEALSTRMLPRGRPQVLTLHNVVRRGRSAGRLLDAFDAVIVHTRAGAELLGGGERVHVIPARRVRAPDQARGRAAAPARARRGVAARGALLRRRAGVQGRRRPARGDAARA